MVRARAIVFGILAATGLLITLAPAHPWIDDADADSGDAKVAETLFKSGKQAFAKGDHAGAITFFKKAQEETPELIEACWWRASAQEKSGDKGAALTSYREFLTLFEGKFGSGATVTKEEQRLKALAEKSVDAMAAGEKELKKLDDGYVASLLAFAKDNFVRDPGVSVRAIEALLAVRPDHEEAQKLREKLGGAPAATATDAGSPAKGAAQPFAGVKVWNDFLANKSFASKETISYADDTMVFDTKGGGSGSAVQCSAYVDLGTSYAYEMEVKVAQVYERGWLSGLAFAMNGTGPDMVFTCAHVSSGKIVLFRSTEIGNDLAEYNMTPLDTEKWHRLGVIVKGPSVEVWFDGKKVLTWRDPSGKDLTGQFGVFQQRCRTERRVFRAGKVE